MICYVTLRYFVLMKMKIVKLQDLTREEREEALLNSPTEHYWYNFFRISLLNAVEDAIDKKKKAIEDGTSNTL